MALFDDTAFGRGKTTARKAITKRPAARIHDRCGVPLELSGDPGPFGLDDSMICGWSLPNRPHDIGILYILILFLFDTLIQPGRQIIEIFCALRHFS